MKSMTPLIAARTARMIPTWRHICLVTSMVLVLFTTFITTAPTYAAPVARTSDTHTATGKLNTAPTGTSSATNTHPAPPNPHPFAGITVPPSTSTTPAKPFTPSMQPIDIPLPPGGGSFVTSSDQRISVNVPTTAVGAADVATLLGPTASAGDVPHLLVTEVAPASGSTSGGLISLGTYLVQMQDGHGHEVPTGNGLTQAITLTYHWPDAHPVVPLNQFTVVVNGTHPVSLPATHLGPAAHQPVTVDTPPTGTKAAAGSTATPSMSANVVMGASSMTASFNTNAPEGYFGKPDQFQNDLHTGDLTTDVPIDVPTGPGGLTPPIHLSYSSAAVSATHNVQAAAPWVGDGWNLDMGAITWSESTDAAMPSNYQTESSWSISDPYGTNAALIPPTTNIATFYDNTAHPYFNTSNSTYANPVLQWHTAPESHAKIISYIGNAFHNVGNAYAPCWRVWLPNGIMEEFGCTPDSLQWYPQGTTGAYYFVTSWKLDMIVDPNGNQIQLTYDQDTAISSYNTPYPRDVVLQQIAWDSRGCHNTQTRCTVGGATGSNWAPLMRVVFQHSNTVSHVYSGARSCGAQSNGLRCDDPAPAGGSISIGTPMLTQTQVLNDISVGNFSNGTWNTLRNYQLAYDQGALSPNAIDDPGTGLSESVAGFLLLDQILETGNDGTTGYPAQVFKYTVPQSQYYEDSNGTVANRPTDCGPSWNTGVRPGVSSPQCVLWSRSYNGFYMSEADNGEGLQQTFAWTNMRTNQHDPTTTPATDWTDPTVCNGREGQGASTAYPCDLPDDNGWSHMALTSKTVTENSPTSTNTNNQTTGTWNYTYHLGWLSSNECVDCGVGMYWGNTNSRDYQDYYNGQFKGFAYVQQVNPDGGSINDTYYTTEGWGVYDNTQVVACYNGHGGTGGCANENSPYSDITNAASGRATEEDVTGPYNGSDWPLISVKKSTWQATCPPATVGGSPAVSFTAPNSLNNGNVTMNLNWDGKLVAEQDTYNPVMVCDVEPTKVDTYTSNGAITYNNRATVTTSNTPYSDVAYSYDTSNWYGHQTAATTTGSDLTSTPTINQLTRYIWNDAITTTNTSAAGIYIVDRVASTTMQDGNGTSFSCSYPLYDGQGWNFGAQSGLTKGLQTDLHRYATCLNGSNWGGSGEVDAPQSYNADGQPINALDADAVAGTASHKASTGSCTGFTSCSTYDGFYGTLPVAATNALNQTTGTGYSTGQSYGFGLWPSSATDANGQATNVTYDPLGRTLSSTLPRTTATTTFATGLESGNPQPAWTNTPAWNGGINNVGGLCCGQTGPQVATSTALAHTGTTALLYSGMDNSATSSYAYLKVFDLSGQTVTVGANTVLSYWIYPQSHAANSNVSGNNSTCVAIDMIFTDGTDLRDSGAVDAHGNELHPAHQCNQLTLDTWNLVTSTIGTAVAGKTISHIDLGYDQPGNTGGYQGYLDDLALTQSSATTTTPFASGVETGDPQPTWTNTPEAGWLVNNVGGICCGQTGPQLSTSTALAHTGTTALLYSGMDTSATSSYAYMKVFDLSSQNITVGANAVLSYWIYPQSHAANSNVSGNNSTCVAIDMIFADGQALRNTGAVDELGNRLHPASQCNQLALDTWNHVTSNIGAAAGGQTISHLLIGYDQPGNTGGYQGYIDDISLTQTQADATTSYTDFCPLTGANAPCLEVDTTQRLDASTTVTKRDFYDGMGQHVETRTQAPGGQDVVQYALYDVQGRMTFESQPYFVTAYTGAPGAGAYSIPNTSTSQPGTTTTYDTQGRPLTTKDPNSQTTTMSYSSVCNAAGTSDTACYTSTTTIDANEHQSLGFMDALGRGIYDQSFTGNGTYTLYRTTKAQYDVLGDTTSTTYADGTHQATATYDGLKRKTAFTDPDLGSYTLGYDPNGNLTSSTDPRGATGTIYQGYDGLDRNTWKSTHSDGSSPLASYSYDSIASGNDGVGHLTSETFASGPSQTVTGGYAYGYDTRGQQTGWSETLGTTTYPFTLGYNDNGQQTTLTYPDGDVVTTSYGAQDWLTGVTEALGSTTNTLLNTLSYTGANGASQLPTSASVGNGVYVWNLSYDTDLRLKETHVQQVSNSTTLFDQTRAFDAVGNVTTTGTTLPTGTDNQAFCYDEQNRLVWAGSQGTPSCGGTLTPGTLNTGNVRYTQTNSYDVLDRLTTGPLGSGYTYGDTNHLDAVTSAPTYTASYDAAGSMTGRNGQVLGYDALRRLITWQNQATSPTQTASYAYNGSGERIQQSVTSGGATTTTSYIGAYEDVATTGGTTTTTKYYQMGKVGTAEAVNGTLYYQIADDLGSVSATLTASGGVQATELYDPFGYVRYTNGTMPTSYGFTKMRQDPSGLNYDHARYYDAGVGQFVTADYVQGPNRYAYVGGNPESITDPSGNCWVCITALAGAIIGAGVSYTSQVVKNVSQGKGLSSLTSNIDVGSIANAAVTGAITGALIGMGDVVGAGAVAGAIKGAITGAIQGGLAVAITGGKPNQIVQGAFWGAVGGGIGGGVTGGLFGGTTGIGQNAVSAAISGFVSNVTSQLVSHFIYNSSIYWDEAFSAGGLAAVGSIAGTKVFGADSSGGQAFGSVLGGGLQFVWRTGVLPLLTGRPAGPDNYQTPTGNRNNSFSGGASMRGGFGGRSGTIAM